jgi:hypothetical protein
MLCKYFLAQESHKELLTLIISFNLLLIKEKNKQKSILDAEFFPVLITISGVSLERGLQGCDGFRQSSG